VYLSNYLQYAGHCLTGMRSASVVFSAPLNHESGTLRLLLFVT